MAEIISFKNFILERVKDIKIRVGPKDLSKDRRFKSTRGVNRKRLNLVPDYRKLMNSPGYSSINNLLDNIKKMNRGIWRVTNAQVIDIAKKYKFFIPNDNFPVKHLGSSGVQLWRRGPSEYFLIKRKKQKYKR